MLMESELKVAVSHLSKQLEVEVRRWRLEAERADQAESRLLASESIVLSLRDTLEKHKSILETERKNYKDATNEIALLQRDIKRITEEKGVYSLDLTATRTKLEAEQQRIQYLVAVKHELELKIAEYKTSITHAKESEDKSQHKERTMKMQLDVQVELSRELESRLEQALTGWKQEKERAHENGHKLGDMKAVVTDLSKHVDELRAENVKLEGRLRLYDSLPMPDEIRARFQDVESDRSNMKHVIAELSGHLKATTETLKSTEQRVARLDSEAIEQRGIHAQLQTELQGKTSRLADLMKELERVQEENRSLRESCKVLELENADLLQSERDLKVALKAAGPGEAAPATAASIAEDQCDKESSEEAVQVKLGVTAEVAATEQVSEEAFEEVMEAARVQDRVAKSKIQRVLDGPRPEDLLPMLLNHLQNESMVWRCMRSLRSLLLQSEEFRQLCVDQLLDYSVIQCMKQYKLSVIVHAQALRLMAALAYGNDKLRRRAGEEGIMALIVASMETFATDETVQLYAFTAVTNLTHNSFENRMRFIEAKGIEAIVAIMDLHLVSEKIQKQACWAVLTLAAEDKVSADMVTKGIPAALANALVSHKADAGVQQFACLAFSNLALAGEVVRRKLKNSGVMELFRVCVENFREDSNIVAAAEKAINALGD